MKLFHRTTNAEKILRNGFQDMDGHQATSELRGILMTDKPLQTKEDASGFELLVVDIPEALVTPYEWSEPGGAYREFVVPADLVNLHGPPSRVIEG
jgi:hypothetical protein